MPAKRVQSKAKSDNVVGQLRKAAKMFRARAVRPRFHQKSADTSDAEPRGVCCPAQLPTAMKI